MTDEPIAEAKTASAAAGQLEWWKSASGASIVVATLALAGTLITGVNALATAYVETSSAERVKNREMAQSQMKIDTDLETAYFKLAVDATSSTEQRMQVLRYIEVAPYIAPEMQTWARDAHASLAKRQAAELKDAEEELAQAQAPVAGSGAAAPDPGAPAGETPAQRAAVVRRLRDQIAELKREPPPELPEPGSLPRCDAGTAVAIQLGPDDPDQASADAYCLSSARARTFPASSKDRVTWTVRHQGRNFQCQCTLGS